MGYREEMNFNDLLDWDIHQYEAMKKANRGHNYQYWTDKHYEMLKNGWSLYRFEIMFDKDATISELEAQEVVKKLRGENNFARIICGYNQNVQRIKMFTVIYKKKVEHEN